MSQVQQNKQQDEVRRATYSKFLSIKSIIRNKKIIIKKTVPVASFFMNSNNTFSTCELAPKGAEGEGQIQPHKNSLSHKVYPAGINTNVVTIKFSEDGSDRNEHKVRRKMAATFCSNNQQSKKQAFSVKGRPEQRGNVEQALVIEPLQKIQNHFGMDRKKGFFNCMLITRKTKKNTHDSLLGRDASMDIHKICKQTTQYDFWNNRTKSNLKPTRTSASFRNKQIRSAHDYDDQDLMHKIKKRHTEKELSNEKGQKQKSKQQEAVESIIKQFKQILPSRKPGNSKNYFVFGMSDKTNEPENRLQLYRDFLWKINYSNGLYVHTPQNAESMYKAFVGSGNNSIMVKSILRRRNWWTIVQSSTQSDVNFIWTQLKINSFFKGQGSHLEEGDFIQINQAIRAEDAQSAEEQQNIVHHRRIFSERDCTNWNHHMKKHSKTQQKITEQTYIKRIKLYTKKNISKIMDSQKLKIHNHLQFNFYLGNKKALFYNMKRILECKNENPFDYVPVTFHICKGTEDPVYDNFLQYFKKLQQLKKVDKNFRNIWICKPGENTNRGNGISVCMGLDDVRLRLRGKQKNGDGKPRTFILQKYIEKPFLYKNRKFDIRHYILLTCFNGKFKAYWFEQGYIRTSSSIFSLKNTQDLMVHLTNDAIQKKATSYGKHEKGNKVSYEDFQTYLNAQYKKKHYDFVGKTLQRMKQIALTAVEATYTSLDPARKQHNFQLIGLDFMIDQNFRPWLIQANTNPCLQLSSPLLQKLIPSVVEQTFRICVDPFFPPPQNLNIKNKFFGENCLTQNKWELIFDENTDGESIQQLFRSRGAQKNQILGKIQQDNQLFEDDGNQNWQQKQKNTI